ncbi:unnamed protein product, partial [Chrysoparadoxa australica]
MKRDCRAAEVFNDFAERYAQQFMDVSKYAEGLHVFMDAMRPEAKVLELGCGPGNVTAELVKHRSDIDLLATDLSPNMLDAAKALLPSVRFELLDIREVTGLRTHFDAAIMAFGMPYLNVDELQHFARDLSEVLIDGATVYLSWIEDEYAKSGEQKSSTGTHNMNMYFYPLEFVRNTFTALGFVELYVGLIPIEQSATDVPRDAALVLK